VLRAGPEEWDTVYALFDGTLPLAELRRAGKDPVLYLQGEVDVTRGGAVEVRVASKAAVTFWVDEEAFESQGRAALALAPGRHRITVRVAAGPDAAGLRVQVTRPKGSPARFDLVQGD
jgi:hypothetical protein